MPRQEKKLSEKIASRAWAQVQKMALADNKQMRQLVSLKPIEIYDSNSSIVIDDARVDFKIKTYLENMIQKRINSEKRWYNIGSWGSAESLRYNFNVVINSSMDYENANVYLNNNFSAQCFVFDGGRYRLTPIAFEVSEARKKLHVESALTGSVRLGPFRFATKGRMICEFTPVYDAKLKVIKVKQLDYQIRTRNLVLKLLDRIYHLPFKDFLEEIIELPVEELMFSAKIKAQEEINKHQQNPRYIFNGVLNDVELERINLTEEEINAVFLINGNMLLTR